MTSLAHISLGEWVVVIGCGAITLVVAGALAVVYVGAIQEYVEQEEDASSALVYTIAYGVPAVVLVASVAAGLGVDPDAMAAGLFPAAVIGIGVLGLYRGHEAYRERRRFENLATSSCGGVTVGLNEVEGTAVTDDPVETELGERDDAIYYEYRIDEQWKSTTSDGDTTRSWKTVDRGSGRCRFELRDDTGSIAVDPEGASFDLSPLDRGFEQTCQRSDPLYYEKGPDDSEVNITNSTGKRRFREWVVEDGRCDVYVMGVAQLDDEAATLEIAADDEAPQFIISTGGERRLAKKRGKRAEGWFATAAVCALAWGPVVSISGMAFLGTDPVFDAGINAFGVAPVVAAGLVAAIVGGLVGNIVYDGLVELQNRRQRAEAMLDVELKRRTDLISSLADVVDAFVGDETRSRRLNELGNAVEQQLFGDVHRAPEVVDEQTEMIEELLQEFDDNCESPGRVGMDELIEELTRCEKRIALARQFYNDSVKRLNSRLEQRPDRWLAAFFSFESSDLIEFEGLETRTN